MSVAKIRREVKSIKEKVKPPKQKHTTLMMVWNQLTLEEQEIIKQVGDIEYRCRHEGLISAHPTNPDNVLLTMTEEQEKILNQATAILEAKT